MIFSREVVCSHLFLVGLWDSLIYIVIVITLDECVQLEVQVFRPQPLFLHILRPSTTSVIEAAILLILEVVSTVAST